LASTTLKQNELKKTIQEKIEKFTSSKLTRSPFGSP